MADAARVSAAATESLTHLRPFLPWATAGAVGVPAQRGRLAEVEQAWWRGELFEYALLDPTQDLDTGPVLGGIGLHRRVGPGGIEIGYWVHVRHTRRGYVSDAAKALTEAALALPGVRRVEIHCDVANTASAGVPRKLGYRLDRLEPREPQAPAETGRHQIWVYP